MDLYSIFNRGVNAMRRRGRRGKDNDQFIFSTEITPIISLPPNILLPNFINWNRYNEGGQLFNK